MMGWSWMCLWMTCCRPSIVASGGWWAQHGRARLSSLLPWVSHTRAVLTTSFYYPPPVIWVFCSCECSNSGTIGQISMNWNVGAVPDSQALVTKFKMVARFHMNCDYCSLLLNSPPWHNHPPPIIGNFALPPIHITPDCHRCELLLPQNWNFWQILNIVATWEIPDVCKQFCPMTSLLVLFSPGLIVLIDNWFCLKVL